MIRANRAIRQTGKSLGGAWARDYVCWENQQQRTQQRMMLTVKSPMQRTQSYVQNFDIPESDPYLPYREQKGDVTASLPSKSIRAMVTSDLYQFGVGPRFGWHICNWLDAYAGVSALCNIAAAFQVIQRRVLRFLETTFLKQLLIVAGNRPPT